MYVYTLFLHEEVIQDHQRVRVFDDREHALKTIAHFYSFDESCFTCRVVPNHTLTDWTGSTIYQANYYVHLKHSGEHVATIMQTSLHDRPLVRVPGSPMPDSIEALRQAASLGADKARLVQALRDEINNPDDTAE